MSRFLRRGAATEPATPTEPTAPTEPVPDSPPQLKPSQRRAPSRRRAPSPAQASTAASIAREASDTDTPTRRSRRRSTNNGAATAPETKSPRRRGGRKSADSDTDQQTAGSNGSDGALLATLQRQNELLEQHGQTLIQLQEATAALAASQQQLTQTLLGATGDFTAPSARIEVLPRLAIFVDVPNILYGAESSGVRLNWGKVAEFLSHGRTLVRAIAYAPISDDPNARTETERFVTPFLDHDYRVATKPLKRFSGGSVKANFDVELAIDVLTMSDRVDVIVLVSGDGDFRRLVEIVGARGVRVEVMAFGRSTSRDLIEVADRYIDIASYVSELVD
jgi:uncharacterized LabA/DUF88 family protein